MKREDLITDAHVGRRLHKDRAEIGVASPLPLNTRKPRGLPAAAAGERRAWTLPPTSGGARASDVQCSARICVPAVRARCWLARAARQTVPWWPQLFPPPRMGRGVSQAGTSRHSWGLGRRHPMGLLSPPHTRLPSLGSSSLPVCLSSISKAWVSGAQGSEGTWLFLSGGQAAQRTAVQSV